MFDVGAMFAGIDTLYINTECICAINSATVNGLITVRLSSGEVFHVIASFEEFFQPA
jgi:hypothetical protein